MTRIDFASVMHYIGLATGKSLSSEAVEVYYDLLGDLPFNVLKLAAQRVVLEHPWATFPSAAELRSSAVPIQSGYLLAMNSADAWAVAWSVVKDTDPEIDGSYDRACKKHKAPKIVVDAINKFGLPSLCAKDQPVSVIRGQFIRMFESLSESEERLALLPPKVTEAIRSIGNGDKVAAILNGVGKLL